MAETSGDKVIAAVEQLMELSLEERTEYCKKVIEAIANSFETIARSNKKIEQARMLKKLLNDLKAKSDDIIPVIFYVVKPEFRDTVQNLIERFAGLF